MDTRRMYARTTERGTAMSETAVCSICTPDLASPWLYRDCTYNWALACNVCGWSANPAPKDGLDGYYWYCHTDGWEIAEVARGEILVLTTQETWASAQEAMEAGAIFGARLTPPLPPRFLPGRTP